MRTRLRPLDYAAASLGAEDWGMRTRLRPLDYAAASLGDED